jgi:hypothetical protein
MRVYADNFAFLRHPLWPPNDQILSEKLDGSFIIRTAVVIDEVEQKLKMNPCFSLQQYSITTHSTRTVFYFTYFDLYFVCYLRSPIYFKTSVLNIPVFSKRYSNKDTFTRTLSTGTVLYFISIYQ